MKKCIVFDVDRTIVDSYMPEILSLQEAIENVTGKKFKEKQLSKMATLTTEEFFKSLNLTEKEILLAREEWHITYNKYEINCFPKIKEIIKELYKKGYIIAIITSRTSKEFHELDDKLNDILSCFELIITSDVVKKSKPDRQSINYLCDQLQLNTENIIYIGDSEIDRVFSHNCNIDFIPACWENKELGTEKNACFTIDDLMTTITNIMDNNICTIDNKHM